MLFDDAVVPVLMGSTLRWWLYLRSDSGGGEMECKRCLWLLVGRLGLSMVGGVGRQRLKAGLWGVKVVSEGAMGWNGGDFGCWEAVRMAMGVLLMKGLLRVFLWQRMIDAWLQIWLWFGCLVDRSKWTSPVVFPVFGFDLGFSSSLFPNSISGPGCWCEGGGCTLGLDGVYRHLAVVRKMVFVSFMFELVETIPLTWCSDLFTPALRNPVCWVTSGGLMEYASVASRYGCHKSWLIFVVGLLQSVRKTDISYVSWYSVAVTTLQEGEWVLDALFHLGSVEMVPEIIVCMLCLLFCSVSVENRLVM